MNERCPECGDLMEWAHEDRCSPVAPRSGERVEPTPTYPRGMTAEQFMRECAGLPVSVVTLDLKTRRAWAAVASEIERLRALIAEAPALYELAREMARRDCEFIDAPPDSCVTCRARAIVARIEGER